MECLLINKQMLTRPLATIDESRSITTLADFKKSQPIVTRVIDNWKGHAWEKATKNSFLRDVLPRSTKQTKDTETKSLESDSKPVKSRHWAEEQRKLKIIKDNKTLLDSIRQTANRKPIQNAINAKIEKFKSTKIEDAIRKKNQEATQIYNENIRLLSRIQNTKSMYHLDWKQEDLKLKNRLLSMSRYPEQYKFSKHMKPN